MDIENLRKIARQTWFDDYLKLFPKESQKETCKIVCKEVCKKILKEVRTHEGIEQMTKFYIGEIIKNLGVEL